MIAVMLVFAGSMSMFINLAEKMISTDKEQRTTSLEAGERLLSERE